MADYSVQEVAALARLPEAEVRRCLKEGVLTTPWTPGETVRLNFQDLVLLRSVAALTSARIAPHRVRKALKALKGRLPHDSSLSSVQLTAVGGEVVVKEGEQAWGVESSQFRFDLERGEGRPPVPLCLHGGPAEAWYQRGCGLDESDPRAAIEAYRQALTRDPNHVDARINLGRLLHAAGDRRGAEAEFRRASELRPEDATIVFNLAVTLEDAGQWEGAITAYARTIFLDPTFADAHFNLARLYEQRGDRLAALRHLSAYRNFQAS